VATVVTMTRLATEMVSFYTPCYVEVRNSTLSTAWLLCGIGLVIGNLLLLLGQHGYAKHHSPAIDVLFWQDSAIGDGSWSWWPQLPETPASYCNMSYVQVYEADDSIWGSESIPCRRTKHSRARLFYPQSNEIGVAFSIAYGSAESDPQYNTSDIYIYEGIELSTIAFHPSLSTVVEAIEHVPNCRALSSSGLPVQNRYEALYPDGSYGEGLLLLSVGDIVRAAGRELDDIGSDGAPLRLSGLEIVAHVDARNYEVPFRWPFAWNPFGWTPASQLDCTVRFKALREHFTTVRWFELREEPIAVQHGLRLTVTTTGHVGYFSWEALLTKLLLAFTAFGVAQSLLDVVWYYTYPHSRLIAAKAFQCLDLMPEAVASDGSTDRTEQPTSQQLLHSTPASASPPLPKLPAEAMQHTSACSKRRGSAPRESSLHATRRRRSPTPKRPQQNQKDD